MKPTRLTARESLLKQSGGDRETILHYERDGERLCVRSRSLEKSLEIFRSRHVIDHMLGVPGSLTPIFCGDGRLNSDRRRIWNRSGRARYDRQNREGSIGERVARNESSCVHKTYSRATATRSHKRQNHRTCSQVWAILWRTTIPMLHTIVKASGNIPWIRWRNTFDLHIKISLKNIDRRDATDDVNGQTQSLRQTGAGG